MGQWEIHIVWSLIGGLFGCFGSSFFFLGLCFIGFIIFGFIGLDYKSVNFFVGFFFGIRRCDKFSIFREKKLLDLCNYVNQIIKGCTWCNFVMCMYFICELVALILFMQLEVLLDYCLNICKAVFWGQWEIQLVEFV